MNCSFKSLLAAVLLLCSTVATAHDFEVGGIFYNIISSTKKTVAVTFKGKSFYEYTDEYIGNVAIPSTVAYYGNTYSVTSIGELAFYGCYGLRSIEIPGSVTSIGYCAFADCYRLTSIVVDGNNRHYDSREGCNAIIETATNTLIQGCKNTIIPGSVTSIGELAFYDCYGLRSIEIPGSVTSIENSAFSGCYGLTNITIPNSVTSIGWRAFYYCYRLKSVTSLATTAPGLGSEAFYGISSDATLYYPAGSDYSSWEQYFANIEEITEEFPEEEEVFGDLNGDGTVSVSDIQVLVNLILSDAAAEDNPAADVNGDGKISVSDIQVVVNRILGK